MSRYKGRSTKSVVDANDLREVADCYRRILSIHAGLNPVSHHILPLMAASATLKACWAELSGASISAAWTYPTTAIPSDGLAPNADRSGKAAEKTYMYRFDLDDRPPPGTKTPDPA
ncbi:MULTISPECIES: hypothetical protein [unclassified Brevundimonas]|uniref:hypothetical protein n=1 Tax=unclassified Brevundimonas TaxID=2622653 RepID=UPI003F8F138E